MEIIKNIKQITMNRLKFGFASIIAILAVTITIAAQAGAFETKKLPPLPDCYLPSISYDSNADCVADRSVDLPDACSSTDALQAPGKKIFSGLSTNPTNVIDQDEFASECNGAQNFVCCVFVIEDTSTPCAGQQLIDLEGLGTAKRWIVSSVACKQVQD
ncbi:hypothetical protein GFS24_28230 [Chitinophaga sp. SYP-B3965]|uniref:hypothetical protein n=1 Tax=Chitinophaga sp. SYP-B3965 TaxID=2663120 RepID=UPI001299EFD8|nr:hypothetical protein [Chitinophaga sp. SYP-B3965]MRG49030.1 hypothetical protein [Chitinophaga sp. SYP-B3965]